MNKQVQPKNLSYLPDGSPAHRIACCLLKEELFLPPSTAAGSSS